MLLAVGCVAAPKPGAGPFVLALRYDVEPVRIGLSEGAHLETAREHFTKIAELGFDTAVLQHVADEDRTSLLDLAAECGLRLAVPDRRIDYFVKTGVWASTPMLSATELAARVGPPASHPAFAALVLQGAGGDGSRSRAARVRELLDAQGVPVLCLGETQPGASLPAIVNTAGLWDGPPSEAAGRLLAQYFDGLGHGRTGGVIVDRFARLPGDAPGVQNPSAELLAGHRAALAELAARARRWGPLLVGAETSDVPLPDDLSAEVRLTVLHRGQRRYLLVANGAGATFLRQVVRLPATMAGATVARAVEVPSTAERGAGRVMHAVGRDLSLPIDLRPRDAALFELF